jgi:uncharacterized protein (DUF58 family)
MTSHSSARRSLGPHRRDGRDGRDGRSDWARPVGTAGPPEWYGSTRSDFAHGGPLPGLVIALVGASVALVVICLVTGENIALALAAILVLALLSAASVAGMFGGFAGEHDAHRGRQVSVHFMEAGSTLDRHVSLQRPQSAAARPRLLMLRSLRGSLHATLAIADASSLPGHPRGEVVSLAIGDRSDSGAGGTIWSPAPIPVERAGVYHLGPTFARLEGLWGLFSHTWQLCPAQELVVYPRAVALRRCILGNQGVMPGNRPAPNAPERPPDLVGVRPHRPGDRLSRIAWRASYRSLLLEGRPMSKQFTAAAERSLWILVDHDGARFGLDGRPVQLTPITDDVSALLRTVALSVALFHLARGADVGLVVSGAAPGVLAPDGSSDRQRAAMKEMLARATTGAHVATWREHERLLRRVAHEAMALDIGAARSLATIGATGALSAPAGTGADDPRASASAGVLLAQEARGVGLDRLLAQSAVQIERGQICILITPHRREVRAHTLAMLWRRGAQVHVAAAGPASDLWRRQAAVLLPAALAAQSEQAVLIAALEGTARTR